MTIADAIQTVEDKKGNTIFYLWKKRKSGRMYVEVETPWAGLTNPDLIEEIGKAMVAAAETIRSKRSKV
jgi:hypothetical protein